MLKCRKNFANLLLLSVMLFALGASVKPMDFGYVPGALIADSAAERTIQWVNHSGSIVYRGQQIAATTGEEFSWKPVNVLEDLPECTKSSKVFICNFDSNCIKNILRHSSRAPPAVFCPFFTVAV